MVYIYDKVSPKRMCSLLFRYVLVICLLSPSLVSAEENNVKLIIAYSNVDSFPFQIGNSDLVADPPGLSIEIIRQAAKDIGLDVAFRRYPNKRVLLSLEHGKVGGACTFSFKKKRLKSGLYPMKSGELDEGKRIGTIGYYFYKLKGSALQFDGKALTGNNRKIGANRGYSIVDDLRNMGIPVTEMDNTTESFTMLLKKRFSGVANQNIDADPFIAAQGYTNIEKVLPAIKSKPYFLMLGHGFVAEHPQIAQKLWDRIGKIRDKKTGEILKKYKYSLN